MSNGSSSAGTETPDWQKELACAGSELIKLNISGCLSALWRFSIAMYSSNPRAFGLILISALFIIVAGRLAGIDSLFFVPTILRPPAILQVGLISEPDWIANSTAIEGCIQEGLRTNRDYVVLNVVDHATIEDDTLIQDGNPGQAQIVEINPPFAVNTSSDSFPSVTLKTGGNATAISGKIVEVHRRIFYTILPLHDIGTSDLLFLEDYSADPGRVFFGSGPRRWYGPFVENGRAGST